jgi:Tripartite tricarboxylate transporter TctB family
MRANTFNTNGPEDGREEIVQPSTSLLRDLVRKKDFYAGGLMLLLGLGIALKGSTYRLGSPMHMGPGFFPTMLGVLLVLVGIAIAAPAIMPTATGAAAADESILPEHPEWWAWFCILMSPVLFILFGRYFGMIPGTFACVFIAALGDRSASWISTIVLSTVVTVFGVVLFSYFLQVPMPILTWGGGL